MKNKILKFPQRLRRPWKNKDGKQRPDSEISRLGKKWNKETWNAYLNEEIGFVIEEENPYFWKRGVIPVSEEDMSIYPSIEEECPNLLKDSYRRAVLEEAFKELSHRESSLLRRVFLNKRGFRGTAEDFQIKISAVYKSCKRAVKKLRPMMESKVFLKKLKINESFQKSIQKLKRRKNWNPDHWDELEFIENNLGHLTKEERTLAERIFYEDTGTPAVACELGMTLRRALELKESIRIKMSELYRKGYKAHKRKGVNKKGTKNKLQLFFLV